MVKTLDYFGLHEDVYYDLREQAVTSIATSCDRYAAARDLWQGSYKERYYSLEAYEDLAIVFEFLMEVHDA